MKNNRLIGSIGIAFRATAVFFIVAAAIRLVIELIFVQSLDKTVISSFPKIFTDAVTFPMLLILGIVAYRRHTYMCTAVNLTPYRKYLSIALAALVLCMLFALYDVFAVKYIYAWQYEKSREFSRVVYEASLHFIPWSWVEERYEFEGNMALNSYFNSPFPADSLFSVNGILLFLRTTLVYHLVMVLGFTLRHVLFAQIKLISRLLIICIPLAVSAAMLCLTLIETVYLQILLSVAVWLAAMLANAVIFNKLYLKLSRVKRR